MLTAEELLSGVEMTFEIFIPSELIKVEGQADEKANCIKIKPLSIGTFQLIMKSARDDATLIPLLMVKEGMVDPVLSLAQVKNLPMGLLEFILENIRQISGLTKKKTN